MNKHIITKLQVEENGILVDVTLYKNKLEYLNKHTYNGDKYQHIVKTPATIKIAEPTVYTYRVFSSKITNKKLLSDIYVGDETIQTKEQLTKEEILELEAKLGKKVELCL